MSNIANAVKAVVAGKEAAKEPATTKSLMAVAIKASIGVDKAEAANKSAARDFATRLEEEISKNWWRLDGKKARGRKAGDHASEIGMSLESVGLILAIQDEFYAAYEKEFSKFSPNKETMEKRRNAAWGNIKLRSPTNPKSEEKNEKDRKARAAAKASTEEPTTPTTIADLQAAANGILIAIRGFSDGQDDHAWKDAVDIAQELVSAIAALATAK